MKKVFSTITTAIGLFFLKVLDILCWILKHPIWAFAIVYCFIMTFAMFRDDIKDGVKDGFNNLKNEFAYFGEYVTTTKFKNMAYVAENKNAKKLNTIEVAEFVEVIDGKTIKVKINDEETYVTLLGIEPNGNDEAIIDYINNDIKSGKKIYLIKDDCEDNEETPPTYTDENGYLLRLVHFDKPKFKIISETYICNCLNYKLVESKIATMKDNFYSSSYLRIMFSVLSTYTQ